MGQCADRDVVYTTNGRVDQNCLLVDAAGHLELRAAGHLGDRGAHLRRASCCRAAAAARRRRAPRRSRAASRTSTASGSSGRAACTRRTAAPTPPASAAWFSLIRMKSNSPIRWLTPPPCSTARFSSARSPGVVLRVSRIFAPPGPTARTIRAVFVATPDSRPRKFSAVRSAVSSARAEPSTRSTGPPSRHSPSGREPRDPRVGIEAQEHGLGDVEPRDHARRLLGDRGAALRPGVDGGLGGRVSVADVLGERSVDQVIHAADSSE